MLVYKKMELNRLKYPAKLCQESESDSANATTAGPAKYTEFSKTTGITTNRGQSTLQMNLSEKKVRNPEFVALIPCLTAKLLDFGKDRGWDKYDLPRNLMLALIGEVGELTVLFQFKPDASAEMTIEDIDKAGQEIADVTIYLLKLAHVCSFSFTNSDVDSTCSR